MTKKNYLEVQKKTKEKRLYDYQSEDLTKIFKELDESEKASNILYQFHANIFCKINESVNFPNNLKSFIMNNHKSRVIK